MDPRVDVSNEALAQQFDLERRSIDLVADELSSRIRKRVALRQTLAGDQKELEKNRAAPAADVPRVKEFDQKALRLQGSDAGRLRRRRRTRRQAGAGVRGAEPQSGIARDSVVDGQDAAPTPAMQTAYREVLRGTGDGREELERADEDGSGESERRAGEAAAESVIAAAARFAGL